MRDVGSRCPACMPLQQRVSESDRVHGNRRQRVWQVPRAGDSAGAQRQAGINVRQQLALERDRAAAVDVQPVISPVRGCLADIAHLRLDGVLHTAAPLCSRTLVNSWCQMPQRRAAASLMIGLCSELSIFGPIAVDNGGTDPAGGANALHRTPPTGRHRQRWPCSGRPSPAAAACDGPPAT